MSHRLRRCCPPALLLLLAVAALAGCGATPSAAATTTTTPTAAPTATATPSAWQVYHGQHFAISSPPGWSYQTNPPPTGATGMGFTLKGPGGDEITVQELYGFSDSQVQDYCRPDPTGTPVTLADIPMTYSAIEGVYRTWHFFNSQHYSYMLSVMDGNQPQATQAQHDQILATFRPDDPTPGCPAGA